MKILIWHDRKQYFTALNYHQHNMLEPLSKLYSSTEGSGSGEFQILEIDSAAHAQWDEKKGLLKDKGYTRAMNLTITVAPHPQEHEHSKHTDPLSLRQAQLISSIKELLGKLSDLLCPPQERG